MWTTIVFLLIVFTNFTAIKATDPCLAYKELNNWKRSVAFGDGGLCDAMIDNAWYRITSGAGERMPTECPRGGFRCGTMRPIWLNDSFPSSGKVKNGSVCVTDPVKGCCMESLQIQIKNCSSFLVYNLKKTKGCPKAYCFGNELPCEEGYTSPTNFTPGCKFDPCLTVNYKVLDEEERSVRYNKTTSKCDSLLDPGWYRPKSKAGTAMPNSCPKNGFACGTYEPIWLKGHLPDEGKTSNVTGCVSSNRRGCCAPSYDIQVKNCTKYNVFNLSPTQGCLQAYCFGSEVRCQKGYVSDNGFTPGCKFEPCDPYNHLIISGEDKRSSNYTLTDTDTPIDDSSIKTAWYRFKSYTGNDMVVTRQPLNQCGTKFPVWVKGSLPLPSEHIVNKKACISDHVGCKAEINIQTKNCGKFIVYQLSATGIPESAYCIGTRPVKGENKKSGDEVQNIVDWLIAVLTLVSLLVCLVIGIIIWKLVRVVSPKKGNTISPPNYEEAWKDDRKYPNKHI